MEGRIDCILCITYIRRKKDIDVINDNDDAIAKMIADMRTRNSQKSSADRPKSASFVLCGLVFFE